LETSVKVCFVCNEYPPAKHGGIGTFVQSLGRALTQAGNSVRVIGYEPSAREAIRKDQDQGVSIWRLAVPRVPFGWALARANVYRTLAAWARAGEIDVVEVADYQGGAAFWPGLQVPLVTRIHGSLTYYADELKTAVGKLERRLERSSLERSDFICSVSRYAAERTRGIFGLKDREISVIYNSVNVFDVESQLRAKDSVVFAGTVTRKKGIISLIRSWPEVLKNRPNAELHVYGKDGMTEEGQSLTKKLKSSLSPGMQTSVHFHGHVDASTLRQALRRARVSAFPSYSEAFSLAPMESMAEGCPTIFTKHATGRELIDDGRHGLLVDPDRPEEISNAIVRVLEDDQLAERLGAGGRRRILEDFNPAEVVRKNEAFYRACAQSFQGVRTKA
jgi:glycosyltransferase involved in cell wall biosynthesis